MGKYIARVEVKIEAESIAEALRQASDIFDDCHFNYREDGKLVVEARHFSIEESNDG